MEEKNQTENVVAKLCKGIAGLFMGVIIVAGFVIASEEDNVLWFFGFSLSGLFFGMMLWGIGEIIRLLHEESLARSCPPKKESL